MKDYQSFKQWEDAANSVGAGGVSMPADVNTDKLKKNKSKKLYDGRTKEGKKFVSRILANRSAKMNKDEIS